MFYNFILFEVLQQTHLDNNKRKQTKRDENKSKLCALHLSLFCVMNCHLITPSHSFLVGAYYVTLLSLSLQTAQRRHEEVAAISELHVCSQAS